MSTPHPIRVYLVDDHEVVRQGICTFLESSGGFEIVGQAGTAAQALPEILRLRPDVAVLDDHLPDGSGIDICREMRAADPTIKGMILTSYEDTDAVSSAILAGASGYVLKQIAGNNLVSGIRLIAGGHSLIDPAVAARVVEQLELQRSTFRLVADLTPQQRKIFYLIGEGLTNRQIAERLFLAEKTVKNHVTAVLAKLGLEGRTQAALLANRVRGAGSATGDTAVPADLRANREARATVVAAANSAAAGGVTGAAGGRARSAG